MNCPVCEQALTPDARCGACGLRVEASCPRCGAEVWPGANFCGDCGVSLSSALADVRAAPPPRGGRPGSVTSYPASTVLTARTGERKQITVVFADLKSSMELLAECDPEDARALIDPVLAQMIDAV